MKTPTRNLMGAKGMSRRVSMHAGDDSSKTHRGTILGLPNGLSITALGRSGQSLVHGGKAPNRGISGGVTRFGPRCCQKRIEALQLKWHTLPVWHRHLTEFKRLHSRVFGRSFSRCNFSAL